MLDGSITKGSFIPSCTSAELFVKIMVEPMVYLKEGILWKKRYFVKAAAFR